MLDAGVYPTIEDLARAKGVHATYVSRVLRLTLLAPEIVEAILDGRQPAEMQLDDLLQGFPLEWARQSRPHGLSSSRGTVALASGNPLDRTMTSPPTWRWPSSSARRRVAILDAKPFDDVRLGKAQPGAVSDSDLETLIRRNASTTWHPTSTCRAGTDDRAVVDPDLRVRGIERLRICELR